ncbi:MAG: hypothetical protein MUF58_02725 [Arcicella sp.]|nr:hypothetical protein [Arcicella sp.]
MKYISIFTLTLLFMGLFACEKNLIEANQQWAFADPNNANLKVVNAYTSNVPAGAPGVGVTRFYIYQNTAKLNGNALSSPGSWPGPATYASLKTGASAFNFLLDRRVGNDYGKPVRGDTAFTAQMTMEAGKYYTMFMIGESPRQSLWLVEDKIIAPKENFYAARFANIVVSATPKPVDVFSRRERRKLVTNLTYRSISEFTEIPISNINDTLDVMDAGTTKILYSFNGFAPVSRRVYTFYTYGRTGFAPERLTNYANR